MSREYNMRIAYASPIGTKEPVSHPVNCKNECPYGHDKAFCFPCMLKIEREMKAKKNCRYGKIWTVHGKSGDRQ